MKKTNQRNVQLLSSYLTVFFTLSLQWEGNAKPFFANTMFQESPTDDCLDLMCYIFRVLFRDTPYVTFCVLWDTLIYIYSLHGNIFTELLSKVGSAPINYKIQDAL